MQRYDAVVVGGGTAGLAAALQLGRACRRVLVAHDGPPRNAPAPYAYGVFTRDGTPPSTLLEIARAQLAPYDVTLRAARVTDARRDAEGFVLAFASGESVHARKLLLATGVEDVLPDKPGFRERWGRSVFPCPYCHGWEFRDRPIALYGRGDDANALVGLLAGWSRNLVLLTDGPCLLTSAERARLDRLGVRLHEEPVVRLEGDGEHLAAAVLASGTAVPCEALFLKPAQRVHADLALRLGAGLTESGCVDATEDGRTSVPGLFVAGDLAPGPQQVAVAAASGVLAAIALNEELLKEAFETA